MCICESFDPFSFEVCTCNQDTYDDNDMLAHGIQLTLECKFIYILACSTLARRARSR